MHTIDPNTTYSAYHWPHIPLSIHTTDPKCYWPHIPRASQKQWPDIRLTAAIGAGYHLVWYIFLHFHSRNSNIFCSIRQQKWDLVNSLHLEIAHTILLLQKTIYFVNWHIFYDENSSEMYQYPQNCEFKRFFSRTHTTHFIGGMSTLISCLNYYR